MAPPRLPFIRWSGNKHIFCQSEFPLLPKQHQLICCKSWLSPPSEQELTGFSKGIARSYASTPLSSAGFENARNFSSSLLETQQGQSFEPSGSFHTKFVYEDPKNPKRRKDKTLRTCIACFIKKRPVSHEFIGISNSVFVASSCC